MNSGLYIAASGMLTNQRLVDIVADNLANEDTPGYKTEQGTQSDFKDLLMENLANGGKVGPVSMGDYMSRISFDQTQGTIITTGRKLDLALNGSGFFAVQTAQGEQYTRDGSLTLDQQGTLVTQNGNRVLDTNGKPIRLSTTQFDVSPQGQISVNGKTVATLKISQLQNPVSQGGGLWSGRVTGGAGVTQVQQGALEQSNVDSADQMTLLMQANDTFSSSQHVLQAIDATLQKAANQIGLVSGG